MLSKRGRLIVALTSAVGVAILVACGNGSAAATPVPSVLTPAAVEASTPTPPVVSPAATSEPGPTASPTAGPVAVAPPQVTPVPAQHEESAVTARDVPSFTWQVTDVDAGTKPALALTSDDVPYVAYMDEAQDGFVKNATWNGTSWDITTVARGYFYGPLDLAIGPDDVAHVAYHDHQDPLGFRPDKGDATYAVLRDGEWSVEAAFDEGHDGWDNRIAIDSQGRPHMSAIDPADFDGVGVEYYRLDESGEWTVESIGSGPQTYMFGTSIAIGPDGTPYISYFDQNEQALALALRDESGWEITFVDSARNAGLFPSLVAEQSGRLHVSYLERTGANAGTIKYATRGADEETWEIREVQALDGFSFGAVGARNATSLIIDDQGTPWIAYSNEQGVSLAIWDGSQWQVQLVAEPSRFRTLGQLVSLKLDFSGDPHIAFFEVTGKRPLTGIVKYAKGTHP